MYILQNGYEESIRATLAVKESELSDEVINDPLVANLAEAEIINTVPDYADITNESELLFLQGAVLNLVCCKLALTMPQRLKKSVETLDVKWSKHSTNWKEASKNFKLASEELLAKIESVTVSNTSTNVVLMGIAKVVDE